MENSWMSPEDGLVCIKIASGEPPYSQRAQALLALNAGASQAEAATQSGLTENQVRYWLGRFRSRGLAVFPDEIVTAVPETTIPKTDGVIEATETVVEEDTGSVETAVTPKSKKKKKASSKKKEKSKKKKKKETNMKKKKKNDKKKKSAKKKKSNKKDNKGKTKKAKKKSKKK